MTAKLWTSRKYVLSIFRPMLASFLASLGSQEIKCRGWVSHHSKQENRITCFFGWENIAEDEGHCPWPFFLNPQWDRVGGGVSPDRLAYLLVSTQVLICVLDFAHCSSARPVAHRKCTRFLSQGIRLIFKTKEDCKKKRLFILKGHLGLALQILPL